MEKKKIIERIKDYFGRVFKVHRLVGHIMKDVGSGSGLVKDIREEPSTQIVYQTTEIEPDYVVYDEKETELKYVAIDKLFAMQEKFTPQEYYLIKTFVSDPVFVKIYFTGTNEALIDYLESLYKEGKFTTNIMDAMTGLGMVVMSFADRMRFVDTDAILREFQLCDSKLDYLDVDNKIEHKKNNS